jgi:hypothetical protein
MVAPHNHLGLHGEEDAGPPAPPSPADGRLQAWDPGAGLLTAESLKSRVSSAITKDTAENITNAPIFPSTWGPEPSRFHNIHQGLCGKFWTLAFQTNLDCASF